jgi:hypothetical protein
MASNGGGVVYDAPVFTAVLAYNDHKKKSTWEVVVEYEDNEP